MVIPRKKKVVKKKTLAAALKGKMKKEERVVCWNGPIENGVTQSMMNAFLVCRERFRLHTVEGLQPVDEFKHSLEFGNMWHLCEENAAPSCDWEVALQDFTKSLCRRYPLQQEQIVKWYRICKLLFPIYQNYWKKSTKKHRLISTEETFEVSYVLPSKRIIKLRGKWDEVFEICSGTQKGIWLKENKTSGQIVEQQIKSRLQFDLQTMTYLIARKLWRPKENIRGVWYNVVRRPLSGGKHFIRQHKPTKSNPQGENVEEYYERLTGLITEEPEHYFMRWPSRVLPNDYQKFEQTYLIPLLEQMCDWWEWVSKEPFKPFRKGNKLHYRTPYGIYNIIAEGGDSSVDHYLNTGDEQGLKRRNTNFSELE